MPASVPFSPEAYFPLPGPQDRTQRPMLPWAWNTCPTDLSTAPACHSALSNHSATSYQWQTSSLTFFGSFIVCFSHQSQTPEPRLCLEPSILPGWVAHETNSQPCLSGQHSWRKSGKSNTVGKNKVSTMEGRGPGRVARWAGRFLAFLLHPGPEQRLQGQHGLTDTDRFPPAGAVQVPHRRAAGPKV